MDCRPISLFRRSSLVFGRFVLCYGALNRLGCLHANWVVCLSTADAVDAVVVLSGLVVTLSADHCLLLLC